MSLVEQHRKCDICGKELFGDELKVTLKRKIWFKIFAWFGNKPDAFFNYDWISAKIVLQKCNSTFRTRLTRNKVSRRL